jgi:hypothetical protein
MTYLTNERRIFGFNAADLVWLISGVTMAGLLTFALAA